MIIKKYSLNTGEFIHSIILIIIIIDCIQINIIGNINKTYSYYVNDRYLKLFIMLSALS